MTSCVILTSKYYMESLKKAASKKKDLVNFYFFGVFSSLFYASFYLIYSLKGAFGDESLALKHDGLVAWMIATLLLLTFIYSLVLKNVNFEKVAVRKILVFALLFQALLFFIKPLGSADIYTYIFRGRIISEYAQNPYIVPYINFPQDHFYSQIANQWAPFTAIYGPLFMLFSALLTYLSQESLLVNVLLFKTTSLVFNITSLLLVWRITKSKIALFLYSWNPIINFELVNNAHNDSFMVFLLLLSIYFLLKARRVWKFILAWVVFWLSILIKFFTLIFAPFLFLFIFNKLNKTKERVIFVVFSAVLSFGLTVFLYAPFWEGATTFGRLAELAQAQNILSSLGVVIISAVLKLLGFADFYKIAGMVGKVIFVIFYFGYLIKVFAEKKMKSFKDLLLTFTLVSAGFYLLFFNWFFPWYFISLISLFILYLGVSKSFAKVNYLYILTFLGILYYIVLR